MKISTDGLTLGCIQSLNEKGYSVVIEEGGQYADVALEAPSTPYAGVSDREGWGSLGEYME